MRTLRFHLGLSLFLMLAVVSTGECSRLGTIVESLWARLERMWENSLLRGPLQFLSKLRTVQLVRTTVRFLITTFIKLPFEVILKVFDFVCQTLQREGVIGRLGLIKAEDLAVILFDDEGSEKIPLPSFPKISDSAKFIPNVDLVLFIPGWTQNDGAFDNVTQVLVNAFGQKYDRVFAVMDLGASLNNLYTWSAYNAREVGNLLGIALSKIVAKVKPENIHLIGAGLGAQIAGFAGKKFEGKTSKKLGRITGLDPSRPCFGNSGLDSSAAAFVDIIHTSKLFGSFETRGHVDFFANRMSTVLPAKGCGSFFCLHQQAVLYLAEAVIPGQEYNFCAVKCESRNRFETGLCEGNKEIFMGLLTPKDARGSHYLNTNLQSPYGRCTLSPDDATTEGTSTDSSDSPNSETTSSSSKGDSDAKTESPEEPKDTESPENPPEEEPTEAAPEE
ncbi:unnamed protein product [Hermetia illucens]|uniref:Lipase domain-containing protein n=2 Tax=Hermetia illucens TaxID=343691 RepID=A0A7R8V1Y2_HERIL|nr:vitellogenin-1-like isoform X2 [Hermetia illucens]CAD7091351.1 unnamed protein product [Hermetia illucens]